MKRRAWIMLVMGLVINVGSHPIPLAYGQDLPIEEEPIIKPPSEARPLKEARLDTERFELGLYAGIFAPDGFGASGVYGLRLAYHVTQDIAFEATYAISRVDQSAFRNLTGRSLLVTDDLWYWSAGVSYDLFPGQVFLTQKRTLYSAIYVAAGFGQVNLDDQNHFSVNIGTGYKLFLTDWLSIRPDFRLYTFETDITGDKKLTYNLEGTITLALFF